MTRIIDNPNANNNANELVNLVAHDGGLVRAGNLVSRSLRGFRDSNEGSVEPLEALRAQLVRALELTDGTLAFIAAQQGDQA